MMKSLKQVIKRNPKVIEIYLIGSNADSFKYDPATGLYTRNFFNRSLLHEIARAKRYEKEASVLYFDIDDFQKITQYMGTMAGEMTVRNVAHIVMNEIKPAGIAARYGEEEIIAMLPETGKVKALWIGEKIREKVQDIQLEYGGQTSNLTVTGGLASFPIDANDSSLLLEYADDALFRAKDYGKDNIALYSMNRRRHFRIDFKADIKVQKIDFSGAPNLKAQTKNISIAGLLFKSDFQFDIGANVKLHIPIETTGVPLIVMGKIVRVKDFDSKSSDIGVSYYKTDKTSLNRISRYVQRQLRKISVLCTPLK